MRKGLGILAAAAALGTGASAQVMLGGNSLGLRPDGVTPLWSPVGDSLDPGLWARGTTAPGFSFRSSWTTFFHHPDDAFTSLLPQDAVSGNARGTFRSVRSSWRDNDRILGLTMELSGLGFASNGFYFKVDPSGTGGWKAASTVGGNDGVSGFSDTTTRGAFSGWMHPHGYPNSVGPAGESGPGYFGRGQRYTDAAGSVFTVGSTPGAVNFDSAVLGWSLVDSTVRDVNHPSIVAGGFTGQMLFNLDEMIRLGVPAASVTKDIRIVFGAYGQMDGVTQGQDMVFAPGFDPFAQSEPVPEPGTLALGMLGLAAAVRRRRARRA